MKMRLAVLGCLMSLALASPAFAFLNTPNDTYTLELKGYSPELVDILQLQVDRQEGRYPVPPPSRPKQVLFNMLNNRWADSVQPFGYDKILPPTFPGKRYHD